MSSLRSARLLLLVLVSSLLVSLPVLAQDTPALPLTATFTSEDGSISFEYPGDWVVEERSGVAVLATRESALDASQQPERGEMRVTLYAAPTDVLPGLEAGAPLEAVLAVATMQVTQDEGCDPFSVPERLEVSGRRMLRATQTCGALESSLIVVEIGGDAVGIIGASARAGSLDEFSETLVEIAGTLEYEPTVEEPAASETDAEAVPELTESFTSGNGALTLDYPDGWRIEESTDGVIGITDGEESIFPDPIAGQLAGYLFVSSLPDNVSATLPQVLGGIISSTPDPSIYGDVETFSIGAYRAVRAHVTNNNADTMIVVMDMGDNVYAVLDLLHLRGRLKSFEPTIYAILGSLEFDASVVVAAPGTGLQEVTVDDLAELDATFITDDQSLGFQYPEDWFVIEQATQGQSYYVISPTEDIANGPTGDAPYLVLQVVNLSSDDTIGLPDDREGRTLATLDMMRQETSVQFTDPQNFSLNGEVVGQMDLITNEIDSRAFVRYLQDDQFVILHAFTATGELEALMPTLLAMVNSITNDPHTAVEQAESHLQQSEANPQPTQVEPTLVPIVPLSLELDETFTSDDGTLTLHYPAGWTLDNSESLMTLQNVEELQVESGDNGLEVAHGEYRVILGVKPSDGQALEDIFTRETEDADIGAPEKLTIGDHDAVSASIDLRVMSGTLYVVDLGNDQVVIVTAIHAPGERATLEPLVSELIKALELTTPA